MNDLSFRIVDRFPEPAFSALSREAFCDYEPSQLLTDVLAQEGAAFSGSASASDAAALRIAGFRGDAIVALVCLTYLVGELRRALHQARARPIRRLDTDDV